jgi:drug/metabolite transporter (DMT)-like permease
MPPAISIFTTFSQAPAPLRGAAWMSLAALAFAGMTALVRVIGKDMHPLEITFFRNFYGLLFMAPWLIRVGWGGLRTTRIGAYGLRGIFGLAAMSLWFWAVTMMPLGEAVALSFTAPLFASLAAVMILGERMGVRRSLALVTGFVGALIILRPGLITISIPAMLVITSSVFIACAVTMVKILARTESTSAIVTWMGLYLTPMSLIPALFVWRMPSLEETGILIAIGGLATLGQIGMTRAYAATDVTIALPFDYARLPFAAVIGFIAFAETPDVWTWLGAFVIAGATVYIAHRESRLANGQAGERIGTATLGTGGAAIIPPGPPDTKP